MKVSQQRFRPNSVLYIICILQESNCSCPYLMKVYAGTPLKIEALANSLGSIFLKGTENMGQECDTKHCRKEKTQRSQSPKSSLTKAQKLNLKSIRP